MDGHGQQLFTTVAKRTAGGLVDVEQTGIPTYPENSVTGILQRESGQLQFGKPAPFFFGAIRLGARFKWQGTVPPAKWKKLLMFFLIPLLVIKANVDSFNHS
jgi:hypothetical protein